MSAPRLSIVIFPLLALGAAWMVSSIELAGVAPEQRVEEAEVALAPAELEVPPPVATEEPGTRSALAELDRTRVAGRQVAAADRGRARGGEPAGVLDLGSGPRWLLRGWVYGPDVADGQATQIRLEVPRSETLSPLSGQASPEGRFEIDVTTWMTDPDTAPVRVVVTADHPGYLVRRDRVWLPSSRYQEEARGQVRATEIVMHVRRPRALLAGEVFGSGPIRVGLFNAATSAAPTLIDEWRGDSGRRYELRVPNMGTYQVVAAADTGQPVWRDVKVKNGRQWVDPLELPRGRTVIGTVLLPVGLDAAGSTVVCEPRQRVQRGLDWHGIGWDGNVFVRLRQEFEVLEKNRLQLVGLAEVPYRVRLENTPGFPAGNPRLGHSLGRHDSGLRIVPQIARVTYRVKSMQGALQGARVRLTPLGRPLEATSDHLGRATLIVPAGRDAQLDVQCSGFAPLERKTTTPLAASSVEMALVLSKPKRATLVLQLAGKEALPRWIEVELAYLRSRQEIKRSVPLRARTARLVDLPVGAVELRLKTPDDRTLERPLRIELVDGQKATHTVELVRR